MAFFKSVFDKVLGKPETDTVAAQPHQQPAGSRSYAEPDFSESIPAEAKLKALWRDYHQASQKEIKLAKAALARFLTLFKETFHNWQGCDEVLNSHQQPPSPSKHAHGQRQHASIFGSPKASGCKAGHPQYMLEGLLLALHQVPADFGQATRKQDATNEELHAVLELKLLEVFQILGCSQLNRQRLIALGCLPALARLIKAVVSRLNTMAAVIGVQDSLQHVGPQLWFLQTMLGHATAVMHTLAQRSLQHFSPDNHGIMHCYLPSKPQYASAIVLEAGSRQEAEHMERLVKPFLHNHILELLHEVLAALQLLRRRGASVIPRWEHLTMECLLCIVSGSRHAQSCMQNKDEEQNILLMLLAGMGWPLAEAHHPAAMLSKDSTTWKRTMQGPGLQLVHDEFKMQLLTLQLVGACMKHNTSNLQAVNAHGGFAAITQLLQWTAFTFNSTTDQTAATTSHGKASTAGQSARQAVCSVQQTPSGGSAIVPTSSSSHVSAGSSHKPSQQPAHLHMRKGNAADTKSNTHWPVSVELLELFAVLKSILGLSGEGLGSALQHGLMQHITEAVLNAFRPRAMLAASSEEHASKHQDLHAAAVSKLSQDSSILQHHALSFLTDLLSVEPAMLQYLRAQSTWELAYGCCFFFWGCDAQSGEGQSQNPLARLVSLQLDATSDGASVTISAEPQDKPAAKSHEASGASQQLSGRHQSQHQTLVVLRQHVLQATETAASLPGLDNNNEECRKLLELLQDRTEDADTVLGAATRLAHILQTASSITLKALDKHDTVTMLAYVIKRQQQLQEGKAAHETQEESPSGNNGWHARCAVLALLAFYLEASADVQRQAVRKWSPVTALFALLWEEQTQQLALTMIVGLMRVAPLTEDDSLGKAALFTKYIEALPHALDSWKTKGLGLIISLLNGIQKAVQQNPLLHQNLFRSAECFVQLLNLLNIDYPTEVSRQLCEKVLATLMVLLAGNEASRQQLQQAVGYDTLLNIVLRCSGPHGPSGGILMQLLHLVLEQAYHKDKAIQLANVDAIPLYMLCLSKAEAELQLRGLMVWAKLVQGNMANLSASDRAGVNGILITWFAATKTSSECQVKIAELLQVTGAYSISGRDLRSLLGLLKRQKDLVGNPPYAPLLLRTLCVMAQHEGPSAFFDFAGGSAGIMRTTPLQLPTSKGYSFATWLRVESGLSEQTGNGGRSLYAMLVQGPDTKGVIAALVGYRVVLRCMQPRLSEVTLPFQFQPNQWYHVVLTHSTGSALTSSMVRLFVNGNLEASSKFKYAKVFEPLTLCSFAAGATSAESGLSMPTGAFHGQTGCLYLLSDVLNPGQISALHALGPDYQSIFAPTDCNPLLEQTPGAASLLIHGKEALGPRLLLSYNAQAAAGRMLYNTAEMDGTIDAERDTAAVLENTQLCCTCQLRDLLHCLGGIGVLLPLVTQSDDKSQSAEHSASAGSHESGIVKVIELMAAVLENSPSNQQTMLQTSGMAILGYLLQHCSPANLNTALLHGLEKLLHAVTPSEPLTKHLLQELLLNLQLWSSAPPAAQVHHQTLMVKLTKDEPALIRHLLPVPRILAGIRAHYWQTPGPDALQQARAGNLTTQELHTLRRGLLELVEVNMKASVAQSIGLHPDDIQALVSFVGDCQDTELLQEALELICSLLQRHSPTQQPMLAILGELGGMQLFMSLMQREQQPIKILGLRILAAFLPLPSHQSPPLSPRSGGGSDYASAVNMEDAGLWPALNDALLIFPLTKSLRLALLNLLCSQQGMTPARAEGPPLITAAPVMGIMLGLLRGCDDADERRSTLSNLKRLIVDGPSDNLAVIVNTSGWQEWLLELLLDGSPCVAASTDRAHRRHAPVEGAAGADNNTHTAWEWVGQESQDIRAMLRALHGYCVQHRPRGWTALEQTACHLRAYASRGVVDGYGLLLELLADVMEDLVDQVAKHNQHDSLGSPVNGPRADSWTMVSSAASEVCRENSRALLGLSLELLSGSLIAPSGQELQPRSAAKQWTDAAGNNGVPAAVWAAVGLSIDVQVSALHMEQQHWRLPDACWRLVYNLQKGNDTSAHAAPQQRAAIGRRTTPDSSALRVRVNSASSAGADEGVPAKSLEDSIVRLLMRMLLLYIQQAPVHRANHCVQQALVLLPVLLGSEVDTSNRCRLQMLLAALNLLHEKLKGQEGGTRRRQVAESAVTKLIEKLGSCLIHEGTSASTESSVAANWQQGMVQQQDVVKAVQTECRCMQHEAARQASAMQLLESMADRRRVEERSLEHDSWESAREALGALCGAEKSKRAAARVAHDEQQQEVARQWRRLQRSLTCDRGIWADTTTPQHYHWKLDKSEDNVRRRMKLKRNYRFVQYDDPVRGAPGISVQPAPNAPDRLLSGMLRMRSVVPEDDDLEKADLSPTRPLSPAQSQPSSPRGPTRQASVDALEGLSALSSNTLPNDDREAVAAQSQQQQGQVLMTVTCELITPKQVVPGTLKIVQGHLHFTGDAPDADAALSGVDPTSSHPTRVPRTHKSWPIALIAELHHARYLLQPRALELVLSNRSSALLSFATPKLLRDVVNCVHNITSRIVIMDRKRKLETAARLQLQWQRWEITNFDYLMQLNTLAGRSFNDLNQYPVFPWVLADYTSQTLDLNDVKTYRDLSKPVGALSEKRCQEFRDRYESLRGDPEIPPFHYGSHYSSAGAVLFYLIRMEPFTSLNRQLQGGRFDHADRLFTNVPATWDNCLHSSSDVKELIPEFFYQPEFLLNSNAFNLGTLQTGAKVEDVGLPVWANGSPDEFIRIQREALESDYVSEHLNDWVDLIFGFKQRGKEAETSCNVFYHLTYEGAVDLDRIEDPTQLKAVEEQIRNFGQTPSQLFKRRHLKRNAAPSPSTRPFLNQPSAVQLVTVGQPNAKRPNIGIACLELTEGRVVLINADRAVSCHRWVCSRPEVGAFTFSSALPEIAYGVEAESAPPRMLGTPFAADLESRHCFAVLPGASTVVSCGYWDNTIRCYTTHDGKVLQSLKQHKDIVTCVAAGADCRTVVSGSRDTTLVIWDAAPPASKAKQKGIVPFVLRDKPRHVLYGHSDAVVCLAVCTELDLVVSASSDGSLLFHTLLEGRYVRNLSLPGNAPPQLLVLAPGPGILLAHSWQSLALHAYTINGRHLATAEGSERLSALTVSFDGRFVLSGGAKGIITLRWIHSLQVVHRYDENQGPITALATTPEDCILAGCHNGCMLVFAPRNAAIQSKYNLGAAPCLSS